MLYYSIRRGKSRGELCLEETARDPLVKDREQEEDWVVVGVWEGWAETGLGQARMGVVFVPVVGQRYLTRQGSLATT